MYKLYNDENNNLNGVLRLLDNAWIPLEEANGDYRAYLQWVAEGNTPEPADERTA
jgi:hypothetical protein